MKIKYVLAGAIVAMFVVPGTASQFGLYGSNSSPLMATPAASATTAGLFSGPSAARLSLTLPSRFVALDIGTHPLQSFHG